MPVDREKTLGTLVAEIPGASRVMERLGLDYCCGGKRSLAAACRAAGVDVAEAARRLEEACQEQPAPPTDWSTCPLAELVRYIEQRHHAFTRDELVRLDSLMEKVYAVHGIGHPELSEVRRLLHAVDLEVRPHLQKEEQILFPYLAVLEDPDGAAPFFGSAAGPIQVMQGDHDALGGILAALRRAADHYVAPEDACRSFRALYDGLRDLEEDLHVHIHLENNVLFPRALEAEQRRGG